MVIENLFPIPVGFFDLGRELTEVEFKTITSGDIRPNVGNITSVETNILKDSRLNELSAFFNEKIGQYFDKTVKPASDVSLKITQSWVNFSAVGQSHHKHSHSNSYISGVFYVQTNNNDKIKFSRDGWRQIDFHSTSFNEYNSKTWWFNVKTNSLILFPSWLEHMVDPVEGPESRISLSFNTFPSGYMGYEQHLTGLKIEV